MQRYYLLQYMAMAIKTKIFFGKENKTQHKQNKAQIIRAA